MKLRHIIILIILAATTIFACNDTVYPDPMKEPVKVVNKKDIRAYEDFLVMPDGTIIADGLFYDEEKIPHTEIKKFERNGNITRYDTISDFQDNNHRYYSVNPCSNSVGEMLMACVVMSDDYEFNYSAIHKFDSKGKEIEKYYFNELILPELVTLLDNGEIVYFTRDENEETGEQNLVLHTIGNSFSYTMQNNFECDADEDYTNIVSFDDKIVLYNKLDSKYCIFRTDGSLICENTLDIHLAFIEYIDDYLYMLSYTEGDDFDEDFDYYDDYYIPHLWHITKMDTLGNHIFDNTINTFDLHNELTVHGDSLIIIGEEVTDYSTLVGGAQIHIFDNNNGTKIETISMNYDNCLATPIYVSPDSKGEYDVYLLRLDRYNDSMYENTVLFINEGAMCIYHTDDLRKLQVK